MKLVKVFLSENKIPYETNVKFRGTRLPLLITSLGIVIHPNDSQTFYNKVKYTYHPIFIREKDSVEFVLEKVKNTIKKVEEGMQ